MEMRGHGVMSPPDAHTAGYGEGRQVWGYFLIEAAPLSILGLFD